MVWLTIALGGAIGAVCRYAVQLWTFSWYQGAIPAGTLLVNVAGSLLIGFIWNAPISESWKPFLFIGILGGFTTFSSYSLETIKLLQQGLLSAALWNIFLHQITTLVACGLGFGLGKVILFGNPSEPY